MLNSSMFKAGQWTCHVFCNTECPSILSVIDVAKTKFQKVFVCFATPLINISSYVECPIVDIFKTIITFRIDLRFKTSSSGKSGRGQDDFRTCLRSFPPQYSMVMMGMKVMSNLGVLTLSYTGTALVTASSTRLGAMWCLQPHVGDFHQSLNIF